MDKACAPVCLLAHRTRCMYSHRCTSPMIVPIIVPAGSLAPGTTQRYWAVIEVTVQQVRFATDESKSLPRSFTTAVKNVGSVALMLPHLGETHSRPVSERVPRPHCCARVYDLAFPGPASPLGLHKWGRAMPYVKVRRWACRTWTDVVADGAPMVDVLQRLHA